MAKISFLLKGLDVTVYINFFTLFNLKETPRVLGFVVLRASLL